MTATDELRNLIDDFVNNLCHVSCGIECDSRTARDGLINDVKDRYTKAIVATLGTTEIVRCRDCANYHDGISQYTGRRFAEPHCLAIGELAYGALFDVDENDFCSWAERREE